MNINKYGQTIGDFLFKLLLCVAILSMVMFIIGVSMVVSESKFNSPPTSSVSVSNLITLNQAEARNFVIWRIYGTENFGTNYNPNEAYILVQMSPQSYQAFKLYESKHNFNP